MTGFSTPLDGFIADAHDDVSLLFGWYGGGDTEVKFPGWSEPLRVSAPSAEHIRNVHLTLGALVTGRRMFDLMKAWGGRHPLDIPVFVVTHQVPDHWVGREDIPFTFVTNGVGSAIEQAKVTAEGRNVGVDGASIVQQAIRAGLVDLIGIDLVPVLLGQGVRYFDHLGAEPIELERMQMIEAPGVTHLLFRVMKSTESSL